MIRPPSSLARESFALARSGESETQEKLPHVCVARCRRSSRQNGSVTRAPRRGPPPAYPIEHSAEAKQCRASHQSATGAYSLHAATLDVFGGPSSASRLIRNRPDQPSRHAGDERSRGSSGWPEQVAAVRL